MERWKRAQRRGSDAAAPALVSVNSYHPSFSSSLLDAIDRSIDKGCDVGGRRDGMAADSEARLHYAWQEDASGAKQRDAYGRRADDQPYRRRGSGDYDQPQQHCSRVLQQRQRDRFVGNSTSSSSESSYGGFSSSEAESVVFGGHPLPRPVRTSAPPQRKPEHMTHLEEIKQKANKSSIRSRFRASKLYGELKKGSSTPVSPGARLASFLNTLFSTAGHAKKAKISASAANPVPARRGGDDSACSSASSYSRSCLSKTPSSRGKAPSSGGSSAKRSVRFYPVSVIVDEDCRPCGQKSLSEGERPGIHWAGGPSPLLEHALPGIRIIAKEPPLLESTRVTGEPPLPSYLAAMAEAEERKRARETARNLVTAYKEKNRRLDGFAMDVDEDDDDDDAASCSSSDLFELKNLATFGCGGEVRYRDELPVYETTRLDANRAIARGLLV